MLAHHQRAQAAADHAGQEWKERAYDAFVRFAQKGVPFLLREVREAHPELPEPPDTRAWGAIATRARREGVVVGRGTRLDRYGSWKQVWVAR